MTIGELAGRTGLSIKALRFYDSLGILTVAGRSAGNYRLFGEETLRCVAGIKRLKTAGLTLREIREVAGATRAGENPERHLRQKYREALERTEWQIAHLERTRQVLLELVGPPSREQGLDPLAKGRPHSGRRWTGIRSGSLGGIRGHDDEQ